MVHGFRETIASLLFVLASSGATIAAEKGTAMAPSRVIKQQDGTTGAAAKTRATGTTGARATTVMPLTVGKCTALKSEVKDSSFCNSGKACVRTDENHRAHSHCISAAE